MAWQFKFLDLARGICLARRTVMVLLKDSEAEYKFWMQKQAWQCFVVIAKTKEGQQASLHIRIATLF